MSSPTPPPPPPAQPSAPVAGKKKPSKLASCILLGLIGGFLVVVVGGGWFAWRLYTAGKEIVREVKENPPKIELPPELDPTKPVTPDPTKPEPTVADTKPTPDPLESPVEPAKPEMKDPEPAPTPEPTPEPTAPTTADTKPEPTPNPVVEVKPEETQPLPEPDATNPDPVVPAEPVKTFAEDAPEVTALKSEADRRIDEAPADLYSDADKQRVREAIRKAKRLTRVATLQFGLGSANLGGNEKSRLKKALLTPEAEALLSDPEAVFFLLGFADNTGDTDVNRKISQNRATGVASVLKGFKVPNTSYSVGIGSSSLVSAKEQAKNRAVEVWIVLP